MNCEWLGLNKGCRCRNCTQGPLKRDYDKPPVRECKAATPVSVPRESHPRLGDLIESALTIIGITQDRYKEVKQLFGLPPTCGCDKRKEYLNRVSEWWRKQCKTP